MLEKLQKIALSIRALLIPTALLGSICLFLAAAILIGGSENNLEYLLRPSIVGLVWAAVVYAFIATFCNLPERANRSQKFFTRVKRRAVRAWYWLIAVVFTATVIAALLFTGRLVSIWLQSP